MKLFLPVLFFFALTAGAQEVNYSFAPSDYDSDIIFRDIQICQDDGFIASFDMQKLGQVTSKPTAGIMKLNLLGEVEWSYLLDIPDAEESCSFDVIQHSSGDFYLIGLYYHTTYDDMRPFVMKLNAIGEQIWTREVVDVVINMSGGYSVNRIYEIANGNLQIMISIFDQEIVMQMDQNGDLIWGVANANNEQVSGKNPGFDVLELQDGKFLSSSKKGGDFALTKYDENGNVLWHKVKELGAYSHIKSLIQTSTGEVYGFGFAMTDNGADFPNVLLRLDESNGDIMWAKAYQDSLFYGTEFSTIHEFDNSLILNVGGDRGGYQTTAIYKVNKDGDFIEGHFTSSNNNMADYLPLDVKDSEMAVMTGGGTNLFSTNTYGFISQTTNPMDFSACIMGEQANVPATNFTQIDFPTQPDFFTTALTTAEIHTTVYELLSINVDRYTVCSTLEIESEELGSLNIYPNPSNETINISSSVNKGTYQLLDIKGKTVLSGNIEEELSIDVSDFYQGVYIFKAVSGTDIFMERVVIQH